SLRRHCEERKRRSNPDYFLGKTLDFFASLAMTKTYSLPGLALLHAGIERVARGVADQVDTEDRDRQQQARPEDQRRLDQEVGAALGHDVAPGRRLRADAGAEKGQDRFGQDRA